MSYDHYAETAQIIFELRGWGHGESAERLQGAMDAGSTGTEIFMALRHELRATRQLDLQPKLRRRIRRLEQELTRQL